MPPPHPQFLLRLLRAQDNVAPQGSHPPAGGCQAPHANPLQNCSRDLPHLCGPGLGSGFVNGNTHSKIKKQMTVDLIKIKNVDASKDTLKSVKRWPTGQEKILANPGEAV